MNKVGFADDLHRKQVCETVEEVCQYTNFSCNELPKTMQEIGIAQNLTKLEVQFHTSGVGAKKRRQEMKGNKNSLPGPLRVDTRYLGVNENVDGHAFKEVSKRQKAIEDSWMVIAKFAMSSAMVRLRKLVFQSLVYNIGLTGMEVWVLSNRQLDCLDPKICFYGRKVMRGAGCSKSGDKKEPDTKFKQITNKDVLRWLQICPFGIELRVRRLKWWQDVVKRPKLNEMLITALFQRKWPWGEVKKSQWELQLELDFQELVQYDDFYLLKDIVNNLFVLFEDKELAEVFVQHDVTVIRRRFVTKEISDQKIKDVPVALKDVQDGMYVCEVMELNGTKCQYSCNSLRGIKMHRRIKHRVRNSVAMAAVTNQCIFCSSVSSDKQCAVDHMIRSLRRGHFFFGPTEA